MAIREKLIELLDGIQSHGWRRIETDHSITLAVVENKAIAEHLIANGVTLQRWIPVTERLPDKEFWAHQARYEDEDLEVLVMIKGAKLPTMLYYNDEGEFYDLTDDGLTFYLVTHWMPKPEPPKEVQK